MLLHQLSDIFLLPTFHPSNFRGFPVIDSYSRAIMIPKSLFDAGKRGLLSAKSCNLDNSDHTIKNGYLFVLRPSEETTLRHRWESHVDKGLNSCGTNAPREAYKLSFRYRWGESVLHIMESQLAKTGPIPKPLCPITKLNFLLEMALEERISIKALSRNSKSPKGCERMQSNFVDAYALYILIGWTLFCQTADKDVPMKIAWDSQVQYSSHKREILSGDRTRTPSINVIS